MKTFRGTFDSKNKKIAIVAAKFNEFITKRLLDGAVETLEQAGMMKKNISIAWVPGALEIPQVCRTIAKKKKVDAIIAIGCVIRGETYHFECVALEATRAISQVSLETGVPVATAVLTVDTLEQAIDRAGLKAGNKGAHAALAALELANLNAQIKGSKRRVKI